MIRVVEQCVSTRLVYRGIVFKMKKLEPPPLPPRQRRDLACVLGEVVCERVCVGGLRVCAGECVCV